MNFCCMAVWKALRVSWTTVLRWISIIVFSTLCVDAAEYAREEVAAKEQRFGGDRLAMVVALVQRNHRFGDGAEEFVAG